MQAVVSAAVVCKLVGGFYRKLEQKMNLTFPTSTIVCPASGDVHRNLAPRVRFNRSEACSFSLIWEAGAVAIVGWAATRTHSGGAVRLLDNFGAIKRVFEPGIASKLHQSVCVYNVCTRYCVKGYNNSSFFLPAAEHRTSTCVTKPPRRCSPVQYKGTSLFPSAGRPVRNYSADSHVLNVLRTQWCSQESVKGTDHTSH